MSSSSDNSAITGGLESLNAKALLRLNFWCDQFEAAWRQETDVDLVAFLAQVPLEEQAYLPSELVLIDIEIRSGRSLPIPIDRYLEVARDLPREWLEAQVARRQSGSVQLDSQVLTAGHQLGDYTIVSQLGSGGMGIVYRAEHRLMKRQVALKAIQNRSSFSKLAQRRFQREVRAAAQLAHPNIVAAFDARQVDGWIYLVSELVEGEDLDKLIRRVGPLPVPVALNYALQAARGLEYAHQQGIVHRDIKPANLLVDAQQRIKILDLGLARWLDDTTLDPTTEDDAALTSSFQILGTAPFMSPEQMRSAASADARSDIYSLGCTLFYMLTGATPYPGANRIDICLAHLNAPIPSVCERNPSIPAALDMLIQTWLDKDPLRRPQSMSSAIEHLELLLKPKAKGIIPPPVAIGESAASTAAANESAALSAPVSTLNASWVTRRNVLLSLVGSSALATVAVAGWNGWFSRRPRDPASPKRTHIADLNSPGLRLKGDGYLEVPDFQVPIQDKMAIEVLLRPGVNPGPANIVTWTGPKSFVLFSDESTRWGIAYFDGQTPRLIIADDRVQKTGLQIITAVWDATDLRVLVDGEQIVAQPIPYELVPAAPRLYIGGIPDGVILPEQGTRYFHGDICAVRILQSQHELELAQAPSGLTINAQTLALFDFSDQQLSSSQSQLVDLTGRWEGRMHWIISS